MQSLTRTLAVLALSFAATGRAQKLTATSKG